MKFAFYSCMSGIPWGGSEELWYRTARRLQNEGHQLAVNYQGWPKLPPKLETLQERGAALTLRPRPVPGGAFRLPFLPTRPPDPFQCEATRKWIKQFHPDAVLIIASYHPDPITAARPCRELGIPYAINVQSASHSVYIRGNRLDAFRDAYQGAERVFFVSEENRRKLELNLAIELPQAEVVDNPYNAAWDTAPTWPADSSPLRLACVGRIHFASKGQDLLVEVLRQPKWRERDVRIALYGENQGNERQLQELIELYGLQQQLELIGFSSNPESIWEQNHGLILPSRYEGAALVVAEAMLNYRPVITTDLGRNREFIDDNVNGFLAAAPTVDLIDEALERAWQKRDQFQKMGLQAGASIRQHICPDPIGVFTEKLLGLASRQASAAGPPPASIAGSLS